MKRLTLKTINKEFEHLGYPERLYKGKDYWYFDGGNASDWFQSGVYVYRLNHLTLEEWVARRNEYEELYQQSKV